MLTDALVLLDTYILELALLALVLVPALALHARRREHHAERRTETAVAPPPAVAPEPPAEPQTAETARIAAPEPVVATVPAAAAERTAMAPVGPVATPVAAADATPPSAASEPGSEALDVAPKADALAPVARIAQPQPQPIAIDLAGPEQADLVDAAAAPEPRATADRQPDALEPEAGATCFDEPAAGPVVAATVEAAIEPTPAVADLPTEAATEPVTEPTPEPITAVADTPPAQAPSPAVPAEPVPPVVAESLDTAPPPVEVEAPPAAPAPTRLLVVDDSAVVRAKLRKLLEGAGHPLDLARDGREALAMLAGARYALMITDLEMPTMSGFELIGAVRGMASLGGMPIVAITGHDDLDAYRSRLPGLSGLFRKPWPDAELLTCIATLLAEPPAATPQAGSPTRTEARPVTAA